VSLVAKIKGMKYIFSMLILFCIFSCNSQNSIPDVSNIKLPLKVQRFEQAFFALDSNQIMPQLDKLLVEYPSFGKNFLIDILGVDPRWPNDTTANYLKSYFNYSKTIYDTSQKYFSDFAPYEKQIKKGLQFVKYYFPAYKTPTNIITFIGPADGSGDGIGDDFLSIGLQAHLGKDFPLYKTDMVQQVYPNYVTARFTPDYIAVNCMKNIVSDMYPDNNVDKRLLVQMVENGKRLYLLSKFLPETEDHKLIGYTEAQMKDSYIHEAAIWDLFVQNNFLQIADNNLIRNYVSEGPKTQELGENAPGNIGSFAGWQIVKKYASKYPNIKPDSLMRLDAEKLYQETKYKP
jgi:hypothetical protein